MKNFLLGLSLLFSSSAFGAGGISASYIRLEPSSLPAVCRQGDLRFDTISAALQMCNNSNTWSAFGSVSGGGTGLSTATAHGVLLGEGTSAFGFTAAGTTGYLLTGAGASTDPSFAQLNLGTSAAITGTLAATNGGTGFATYTLGDFIYSSAANTLAKLAGNTTSTKKYLSQTGTGTISAAPAWAQVAFSDLSGSATAAQLPNPSSSSLGGVQSIAAVSHNFLTSISTSGVPAQAQPAFTDVSGTAQIAQGGTGLTSVTTAPAATTFAGWDANKNLSANSVIEGYATTATAAGTTALLVGSSETQYFTGTSTQTVTMPATSALVTGQRYRIVNLSSGVVTVQSSGANTIQAMGTNTQLVLTVISTSGTGTASWDWAYGSTQASLGLTNPMTTGGDVIYGGASGVPTRLANGSSGQVLTSAGSTSAPTWTSISATSISASKVANYTALTTDGIIRTDASGGSFTVTLYTAVGNAGSKLTIVRTDQTLANSVTIDANGSETIRGALTVKLSTQYESFSIVSDGANWIVQDHFVDGTWAAYTPTIANMGTNSNVNFTWSRQGSDLYVRGTWTMGSGAGSAATITVPSGLTTASSSLIGSTQVCGNLVQNANSAGALYALCTSAATVVNIGESDSTHNSLALLFGNSIASSANLAIWFRIPISGWEG